VAESLGRALGVAPYAIQTFTEAEIRANVVFQVCGLDTECDKTSMQYVFDSRFSRYRGSIQSARRAAGGNMLCYSNVSHYAMAYVLPLQLCDAGIARVGADPAHAD
jgi:hypothetical protein